MAVFTALLDAVRSGRTSAAFFFPEVTGAPRRNPPSSYSLEDDLTIFQFWPPQLSDSHNPNYANKDIPGGSHPLKQWVGGGPRTLSFEAVFTREVKDTAIARQFGTPSARYSVDIAGARSRIERFKQPYYRTGAQTGITEAPERVILCFPNMQLGGNVDEFLCYLTAADVTYERCFEDGTPRIMVVSLTFEESVQHARGGGPLNQGSAIRFHGRDRWQANAPLYRYTDGDKAFCSGAGGN